MKQLAAIIFSLLLIVTQTFAVALPVGGGAAAAKAPSCCACVDCQCCIGQADAPVAPPVQSASPVGASHQFIFSPVPSLIFTLAEPANELSPATTAAYRAATLPLFQRNCALLL